MSSLIIVKPVAATLVRGSRSNTADYPNATRVISPNPKEAAIFPAGDTYYVDYDFGVAVSLDSFFFGYHDATSDTQTVVVQVLTGFGQTPVLATAVPSLSLPPLGLGAPFLSFIRTTPFQGRYWRVIVNNPAGNTDLTLGVVALGLAFQTAWGQEFGAGRLIEDTGTAERLFGGGFGIDDGVATTGYQWTFGDLQPAELRQLFQLVKDRRTTRSVLVVEDPDQTDGLNERIHWGLLRKLEAYERVDKINTKWALQIADWA